MAAMMDHDRNGTLDYEEFQKLWSAVREYKETFSQQDVDKSGGLSCGELGQALSKIGFEMSDNVLSVLIARFSDRSGLVCLDDFVQICCRVKSAYGEFWIALIFYLKFFLRNTYFFL